MSTETVRTPEFPVWEQLLHEADATHESGMGKPAYIEQLDDIHRQAQVLAHLNYQVLNGGFRQWVDNGYGLNIAATLDAVRAIGTANAAQVANMLEQLEDHIITDTEDRGCFGDYWVPAESDSSPSWDWDDEEEYYEEEECEPEGCIIAEQLDSTYYNLYEAFQDEIEQWLSEGAPDRSEAIVPVPTLVPEPSKEGIRYPNIRVKLVGQDGNAFVLMGIVQNALEKHKVSAEECKAFREEATAGDYDHLLRTCMAWVDVH